MPVFILLFGLVVGGVISGLFFRALYKRSILSVTNGLRQFNHQEDAALLRVPMPGDELALLVLEINRIIAIAREMRLTYRKNELDLRHAIENVSHDLRTPLTSILGYLQVLEDPRITQEESSRYFSIIRTRAEALGFLINQFYDLSRIQANEYTFELEPLDLPLLLAEQMVAYYQEFTRRGLEPSLSVEEKLPPVLGDKGAVLRILTNLLENALKYGQDRVDIRLAFLNGQVVSIFTNRTQDLHQEDIPRLFDRFFTVDRMRTGQSTGLGLAIVKAMAEGMGHRVWATGEENSLTIGIRWRTLRGNRRAGGR